jgi:hypothetical protein
MNQAANRDCLLLVYCLVYSLILIIGATFSSETSVEFNLTAPSYTEQVGKQVTLYTRIREELS